MNYSNSDNFRFLNLDGQWPTFDLDRLERQDDGSLTLATLPRLLGELPEDTAALPAPDGPAGITVADDGTVFFSRPSDHSVRMIDPCVGTVQPVPCIDGEGGRPTQLRDPRGLLVHRQLGTLMIADSGNDRIQLFDVETFQFRDFWHGPDGDRLRRPSLLAADSQGNVYVVEPGDASLQPPREPRLRKFDLWGNVINSFWENVTKGLAHLGHPLRNPVGLCAASFGDEDRIFVLEDDRQRGVDVFVFDADGTVRDIIDLKECGSPFGLAVTDDSIYVGDNLQRRLLRYRRHAPRQRPRPPVGEAFGYEGPVAGLAADECETLLLHTGSGDQPLRFEIGKAYVERGVMYGGPFEAASRPACWQRLQSLGEFPAQASRITFFLFTTDENAVPGPPPDNAKLPSVDSKAWQPMPPDVTDMLIGSKSRYLWVAALMTGDGTESPRLEQIKVEFDRQTYFKHLPAIYQQKEGEGEPLERLLRLFESLFRDVEGQIEDVERLFDVDAAEAPWLDWLAGWLAVPLDQRWTPSKKPDAIRRAYRASAWRGTSRGLRDAIAFHLGLDAHIEEPLINADWWSMPGDESPSVQSAERSVLGFSTRLAGSHPQGAVLGSSAVLDQSQLTTNDEFGSPLFADTAYQFTVHLYRAQIAGPETLEEAQRIIHREKPAHTAYQLCVIEPEMRVGYQSVVGVDTVIGGAPVTPTRLGEQTDDSFAVLAGAPPGRLGKRSVVGRTTRLDNGAETH